MTDVEKFDFSYLSSIVCSVRFVVPGAMALVTAWNTVTERVIKSRAHGVVTVVDQREGEEVVDQREEVVIVVDQGETCKYWNVL